MTIGTYIERRPMLKNTSSPFRGKGYIVGDDFCRESLTPTSAFTFYGKAATGSDTSAFDTTINRVNWITAATAGDDVDVRTASLRFERAYSSLVSGMASLVSGDDTTTLEIYAPFQLGAATNTEGFVGLLGGVSALTALPTTARHMGIYWDASAQANFRLTSSNATTQVDTDTTIALDTAVHILHIIWTGEDAATLEMLNAAGAVQSTIAVTAFNLTAGTSHQLHWFIQTETGAATLRSYPWRAKWT